MNEEKLKDVLLKMSSEIRVLTERVEELENRLPEEEEEDYELNSDIEDAFDEEEYEYEDAPIEESEVELEPLKPEGQ